MIKAQLLKKKKHVRVDLFKQLIFLSIGWSIFTLIIMGIDMRNTWKKNVEAARLQAKIAIDKDIQYRFWSARLGGVYAPVGENLQPNSYLNPEIRDLTTSDGRQLTLINPAYMTRQVHELVNDRSSITGHITSLNPIRPENKPDDWETIALNSFEKGEEEFFEIVEKAGESYMRVMKPLLVDKNCLKCHAHQGYKEEISVGV